MKKLILFKLGNDDRPATGDDIINFEADLKKALNESEGDYAILVGHHAIQVDVIELDDALVSAIKVHGVPQTNTITFEQFVQHGIGSGANVVNGMPWSFSYRGNPVTHENDECYLISTSSGQLRFTPQEVLITVEDGSSCVCELKPLVS